MLFPFSRNIRDNVFAFALLYIVLTEVAGIRQNIVNRTKAAWEATEAFHRRDEFQFVIALLCDVIFYNEHGLHIH